MVRSQRHRGPDGEGVYVDPQRLAGLGHNRLSIIDLSDGGKQPMMSTFGNHVIVLNGEIYNYLELKRALESEFTFRSNSDTEVLLAAYQEMGQRLPRQADRNVRLCYLGRVGKDRLCRATGLASSLSTIM